ncbi:hypothetical protein Tco_1192553, partial [Tanacetum coccineum]
LIMNACALSVDLQPKAIPNLISSLRNYFKAFLFGREPCNVDLLLGFLVLKHDSACDAWQKILIMGWVCTLGCCLLRDLAKLWLFYPVVWSNHSNVLQSLVCTTKKQDGDSEQNNGSLVIVPWVPKGAHHQAMLEVKVPHAEEVSDMMDHGNHNHGY